MGFDEGTPPSSMCVSVGVSLCECVCVFVPVGVFVCAAGTPWNRRARDLITTMRNAPAVSTLSHIRGRW